MAGPRTYSERRNSAQAGDNDPAHLILTLESAPVDTIKSRRPETEIEGGWLAWNCFFEKVHRKRAFLV
jgi:hypothetical protein